jgi:hypothetical protein
VLFLKATQFRRLLPTFKGEKFLTIQVTGDVLLMGRVRLHLESNEMLLYPNPDQAPPVHPGVAQSEQAQAKPASKKPAPAKRRPVRRRCSRQLTLWPDFDIELNQDDKG